jgi:hypothetical protein
VFILKLDEPIDIFDGLIPLHDWIDGDAERMAWSLRAVLALAAAAPEVGWQGDMRHLPMVGHLPTTPYLVVKQDNNGDTFLVSSSDQVMQFGEVTVETKTRNIGAWIPPTLDEMRHNVGTPDTDDTIDQFDPTPF